MLVRTSAISSVSTHFDIAPSLLAFLHHSYQIKIPVLASWMGTGLDTTRDFRNIHAYPLMQTKTDLVDFVAGDYHVNQNNLYKLSADLSESPFQDDDKKNQFESLFELFLKRNALLTNGSVRLIPDTILHRYLKYKQ